MNVFEKTIRLFTINHRNRLEQLAERCHLTQEEKDRLCPKA